MRGRLLGQCGVLWRARPSAGGKRRCAAPFGVNAACGAEYVHVSAASRYAPGLALILQMAPCTHVCQIQVGVDIQVGTLTLTLTIWDRHCTGHQYVRLEPCTFGLTPTRRCRPGRNTRSVESFSQLTIERVDARGDIGCLPDT
jgi:hypothetical protein